MRCRAARAGSRDACCYTCGMQQVQSTSGVVTYQLFIRHFERLALANLAAVILCLLVIPAPLGLAGLLGVVESIWRKPSRRPGPGEFAKGIRRYWKPMLVQWLLTLAVLAVGPVSLLLYGALLEGKVLWTVLLVEVVFLLLLWVLWIYALGSAVADRARKEGRAHGEQVGLVEGFSHHAGPAFSAWLIHLVMVLSVAGLFAVGLALPVLYILVSSTGPENVDLTE